MASIGASRSVGGPLSPAAQFVVEGRIGDDGRLELAILPGTGGRQVMAATFAAADLAAAFRWLDEQTAAAASKSPPSAGKDGDWAVRQSKAELGRFKALGEATVAFAKQADLRRIENGLTQLLPEDQARLDDLARARRAAGARAYHLDPASEPAMAAANVAWTSPIAPPSAVRPSVTSTAGQRRQCLPSATIVARRRPRPEILPFPPDRETSTQSTSPAVSRSHP
jgi:hypothetical protein